MRYCLSPILQFMLLRLLSTQSPLVRYCSSPILLLRHAQQASCDKIIQAFSLRRSKVTETIDRGRAALQLCNFAAVDPFHVTKFVLINKDLAQDFSIEICPPYSCKRARFLESRIPRAVERFCPHSMDSKLFL